MIAKLWAVSNEKKTICIRLWAYIHLSYIKYIFKTTIDKLSHPHVYFILRFNNIINCSKIINNEFNIHTHSKLTQSHQCWKFYLFQVNNLHRIQWTPNLFIASSTGHVTIFCLIIYIYLNTYTLRIDFGTITRFFIWIRIFDI